MKIGYFSSTYYPTPDGVSHYLRDVKETLEGMGHEVHIFSFSGNRRENNVHVTHSFPLPMYTQYSVPATLIPFSLYRKSLKEDFDIVHIHDPFVGSLGYRVAKSQNIPIFGTFHTDFVRMKESMNLPLKDTLFSMTWKYNLYLYKRCREIFVPSLKSRKYLIEYGLTNTVELPLFVDSEKFRERPGTEDDGSFVVQFLGRITRDKGAFRLLDVAEKIPESENIRFIISGTGPDEELLRKLVRERGLSSRVEITGYVDEETKLKLLGASSLFIYPASADTFGISVLEALSFGVPTIVARDFPLLEYANGGDSGLITFNFTDPENIASYIVDLRENKSAYEKLSRAAFNFSRDTFSKEAHCKSLIEHYEMALKK
jgi:glycosyltransferase involved in cell wall biosynthesis